MAEGPEEKEDRQVSSSVGDRVGCIGDRNVSLAAGIYVDLVIASSCVAYVLEGRR